MHAYRNFAGLVYRSSLLLVACFILNHLQVYACSDYKKIKICEASGWKYGDYFFYELTPPSESGDYDIYVIIRHTADYPFYNLHLKSSVKNSNNECLLERVDDFELFDSATGRPLGHSLIWRSTIVAELLIAKKLKLQKDESCCLAIGHFMRVDQLQGVESIAIKMVRSSN